MPAWIDEMLAKLHAIYGKKWNDHVSGIPYEALRSTWGEAVVGWSKADAKCALDHCAQTMPWPPALPDFLAAKRVGETAEQRAFFARAEAEQLALPSTTWAESRAQYRGVARELLVMLRGDGDDGDPTPEQVAARDAEKARVSEELLRRAVSSGND